MADWKIRAIKTFVQSFFGILIPELCLILNGAIPESISGFAKVFTPIFCSALAAGISAAWNIINEKLKEG